ncbi:MAG: hypothetical protein M9934_03465 [Thermomicrobiales bacterium]|nr:hypothetical protein [Thermomicrobiales bacterium]
MYGEHFDIPQPDEQVFISWFKGGEVFRSGCCFSRGAGKVFYFQPGHETNPTYYDANIQKVIVNAVEVGRPEWQPDASLRQLRPARGDRGVRGPGVRPDVLGFFGM